MIECTQKVSRRVILSKDYIDYPSALRTCQLSTLFQRREKRVLAYCHKALKHNKHKQLFPISSEYSNNKHNLRNVEKYKVNFAKTHAYQTSFILYAQSMLNKEHLKKKHK